MSFVGKFNAGMTSMARGMKNGADNCKLEGKVAEQEKLIKNMTKEIGTLVLIQLEAGEQMSPGIMERFAIIQNAKAEIEQLGKERKVSKIVCPHCGEKTAVGMKYCGNCGELLEVLEPVEM